MENIPNTRKQTKTAPFLAIASILHRCSQSEKEPRSMLKQVVVPLGGFDFKMDKPLLQNEKVQDFNNLITVDT